MLATHSRRRAVCPCGWSSYRHLRIPSGSGLSWPGRSCYPAWPAQGPWKQKLVPLQQQPAQPHRVCLAVPTEDLDLIDQLLADIEPPPPATPPAETQLVDTPAVVATSTAAGADGRAPSRLLQRLKNKRSSTNSDGSRRRTNSSSQDPQPAFPSSPAARKQPARSVAAASPAAPPRRPSGVIQLTDWDSTSDEIGDELPRTRGDRTAAGAAAAAGPGLPISPWQALRQELAAEEEEERQRAAAAAAAAAAEQRRRRKAQAEQPPLPAVTRALGQATVAAGGQGGAAGSSDLPLVRSSRGRSSRASMGPAAAAAAAAATPAAAPAPVAAPAAAAAATASCGDASSPEAGIAEQRGDAATLQTETSTYAQGVEGAVAAAAAAATLTQTAPQAHAVTVGAQQQQQQQQGVSATPATSPNSSNTNQQRPAARRGSRSAAASAAVAAARASAAAAGLLEGLNPATSLATPASSSRPQAGGHGARAVPVGSLGPITRATWQEAGQAAFPGLFDSSWHTSLYALLVDLCDQVMDWQQQQQQQKQKQDEQQQEAGPQAEDEEQRGAGQRGGEGMQVPFAPAGSTPQGRTTHSSSSGQPTVDVEQIGGFLAACLSSDSMYAQLSAGLALASRAACRPLVLQPLSPFLAPTLLQQTLLPCLSLLAPDAVVEVLRVLRRLHPAAPLTPSPSKELLAALGQLEGLLGVFPGSDLGLLVHVAPAHGLLQD